MAQLSGKLRPVDVDFILCRGGIVRLDQACTVYLGVCKCSDAPDTPVAVTFVSRWGNEHLQADTISMVRLGRIFGELLVPLGR
jgi:hypothetical protein